jgi:diketogulonate reductase-like aldo/keto reductase
LKTVKESIKDSLEWLGLEYVDLYLIHNPAWGGDIKDTWREMRGVKKEGWAKSIGVSKYVLSRYYVIVSYLDQELMIVSPLNNLKKSSTTQE